MVFVEIVYEEAKFYCFWINRIIKGNLKMASSWIVLNNFQSYYACSKFSDKKWHPKSDGSVPVSVKTQNDGSFANKIIQALYCCVENVNINFNLSVVGNYDILWYLISYLIKIWGLEHVLQFQHRVVISIPEILNISWLVFLVWFQFNNALGQE